MPFDVVQEQPERSMTTADGARNNDDGDVVEINWEHGHEESVEPPSAMETVTFTEPAIGRGAQLENRSLDNYVVTDDVDDNTRDFSSEFPSVSKDSTDNDVRQYVDKRSVESISLHRKLSKALNEVSLCKHGTRTMNDWYCRKCTKKLAHLFNEISLQSAVLGRYIRDVLRCGEKIPAFTRRSTACITAVMEIRVLEFER